MKLWIVVDGLDEWTGIRGVYGCESEATQRAEECRTSKQGKGSWGGGWSPRIIQVCTDVAYSNDYGNVSGAGDLTETEREVSLDEREE